MQGDAACLNARPRSPRPSTWLASRRPGASFESANRHVQLPVGRGFDHEDKEELAGLEVLAAEATKFVQALSWAPPLEELVLAFGVAPILALFLARFSRGIEGEGQGDTETWIVVGDVPYMYFETEEAPDPANALRFYCAIAQDWADTVIEGRDLSDSYPVPVAPTREHAEMLNSRIEFIRKNLVPLAWD